MRAESFPRNFTKDDNQAEGSLPLLCKKVEHSRRDFPKRITIVATIGHWSDPIQFSLKKHKIRFRNRRRNKSVCEKLRVTLGLSALKIEDFRDADSSK